MDVKLSNLIFSYDRESNVLENIDFFVKSGETFAVLGVSGCGKTTLLNIISGLIRQNKNNRVEGEVTIGEFSPIEFQKRQKLSFMFQEYALMPNLTVEKNISFPLKIRKRRDEKKVDRLMELVGLYKHKDKYPYQLSGGMKTRVSLAMNFIAEPELILMDEPFSALDVGWKNQLYNEFFRLREELIATTILVTHDIDEAISLAKHILILSWRGNILEIFNNIESSKRFELFSEIECLLKNDRGLSNERVL